MKRVVLVAFLVCAAAGSSLAGDGCIELSSHDFSSGTYTVEQAGCYRFTEDIVFTNVGAIGLLIAVDEVSIDLNGFGFYGPGSGSGNGIIQSFSLPTMERIEGLRLYNGTIAGWGGDGASGVVASGRRCRFEGLVLRDNYNGLLAIQGAIVTGCRAGRNVEIGIGTGPGSIVRACTARENGKVGFTIEGILSHCTSVSNGNGIAAGAGALVSDCVVSGNETNGILTLGEALVTGCSVSGNGREGILLEERGVVKHSTLEGNTLQGVYADDSSSILRCIARGNGEAGITVRRGCLISRSISSINDVDGIEIEEGSCRVADNVFMRNGYSGLWSHNGAGRSHIRHNTARGNSRNGIEIMSGTNLVMRNLAADNPGPGGDYRILGVNSIGPLTTNPSNTYETANFDF